MRNKLTVVVFLCSLLTLNEALRILVCFPMPSKSHSILGFGVVDRLLEAGHEVENFLSFNILMTLFQLEIIRICSTNMRL